MASRNKRTADLLPVFRQMIGDASRIVAFTGAGISTESGIPDFRGPSGIWGKMKPVQFQDFISSEEVRQESWRRKFENDAVIKDAQPNQGHRSVAKLQKAKKLSKVITQNIDNLHQNSGIPDDQVIELHGNATYAHCLSCNHHYALEDLKQQFQEQGRIQPCALCQGIIKSATISFGQNMPEKEMQQAHEAVLSCDLCVVLGSSLVVYPAAMFPELAKKNGATLVIINQEDTPLDDIADLNIQDKIGQTMTFATEEL